MRHSIVFFLFTVTAIQSALFATDAWGDDPSPLLTGSRFRDELDKPINITRPDIRLREFLHRLSDLHRVAILLDRRVNPDQHIDVQLSGVTLSDGLELIAHQVDADAAIVSGTIVIAPPDALDRMRTGIVLQHQFLHASPGEDVQERSFDLLTGKTFRWDDLTMPTDLIASIAHEFDLTLSGDDVIPHDLWAAGVMTDVSAVEALTLIAGQFDLTCRWNADATAVQLAPVAARQSIKQTHSVPPQRYTEIKPVLAEIMPLAELTYQQGHLTAIATVGEHEHIAALLKPETNDTASPMPHSVPLRSRRFTLKTKRAAIGAILRTLESQGARIEYDPAALRAAGIDLNQKVSLSLDQASADEFFQALCEPVDLQYEIEGETLFLSPRQ